MKTSIAKKLTVCFLVLSLASTAVVGFYSYKKARGALIERIFEQLTSIRTEKENRLYSFFNQQKREVQFIADLLDGENDIIGETNDEDYFKYLKIYYKAKNSNAKTWIKYADNKIFDLTGFNKNISDSLTEAVHSNIVLIKKNDTANESQGVFITEIKPGLNHELSSLLVVCPLRNRGKRNRGFIMLGVNSESLNDIMYNNNPHSGLGKTGEAYVVGSDYLMRSNSRFHNKAPHNIVVDTEGVKKAFSNITGAQKISDYRGVPVFSSYSKLDIKGLQWVVLAEIDVREAMVPIYNIRNNIIFLSLLIALLLIGIVAVLANMIAAPIKRLKQETEKVSKGLYGKIIVDSRRDEIGDLILAFNHMTIQLKEQAERIEIEKELRLSSIIDGQEMERQRLSRELHDGLGQLILSIKMRLERALVVDTTLSQQIIVETQTLFASIIDELRNISNNLMPAVLKEFGLITGLRDLVLETAKNSGVEMIFNCENSNEKFGEKIDTYLYRIAQEAINNALKHATPTKISVNLIESTTHLLLSIYDNGKGVNGITGKGNGISNMKERAYLMKGEFEWGTNSNKTGTYIKICIPK